MQYFSIKQFILNLIFTFYFRKTGKPLLFILITLSLKRSRKEGFEPSAFGFGNKCSTN